MHVWTSGDAKLKVWNASKLDVHREINIDAFVLAMTQVDDQIWAACNDKKIRIFNTKVDAPISVWPFPHCRSLFLLFLAATDLQNGEGVRGALEEGERRGGGKGLRLHLVRRPRRVRLAD